MDSINEQRTTNGPGPQPGPFTNPPPYPRAMPMPPPEEFKKVNMADDGRVSAETTKELELMRFLNKYSFDNLANVPDYLLAPFVTNVLAMVGSLMKERDHWTRGDGSMTPQDLSRFDLVVEATAAQWCPMSINQLRAFTHAIKKDMSWL